MEIFRGGSKKPPRIVVYGPPKVGKSTLGSEAVNPIFVTTEEGVDTIEVDQFQTAPSWEQFLANIEIIVGSKNDYKTLVIDTLNGAAQLAAQSICDLMFKSDWSPKGFQAFGQGWTATAIEMKKLIPLFDKARAKGMTVLLLAHTGIANVKNPVEGDYQKYTPDLDKRVWSLFLAWADIICRADFDYTVLKGDGQFSKGRAVGTSTRILRCEGSAAEDAGCRVGYELPPTIPLSWNALASALGDKTSLVREVNDLWALLTDEEATKALKFLAIQSLDDIRKAKPQKLGQILNGLREKAKAKQEAA